MDSVGSMQTSFTNNMAQVQTKTKQPEQTVTLQEANPEKKEAEIKIASAAVAALGIAAIAIGAAKGIKTYKAKNAAGKLSQQLTQNNSPERVARIINGRTITGARGTLVKKTVAETVPAAEKAVLTTEQKVAKMKIDAEKLAKHNEVMKAKQAAQGPINKAAHEAKLAQEATVAKEKAAEAASKVVNGEATVTQLKNQGVTKNLSHDNKKVVKEALKEAQQETKPANTMTKKEADKLAKQAAKAERKKQFEAAEKEKAFWHKTNFSDKNAEESANVFEEMFAKEEGKITTQTASKAEQGAQKAKQTVITDQRVLGRMNKFKYKSEKELMKIVNNPKTSNIDRQAAQALLDKIGK